eukprot:gb/GFBE01000087.1/.p1 GENE.gb/GFBE01000087.1/~~gb/GFBE01000087.1/.p1  ORF type:complete len:482 (+),score=90.92 gb/GFBE01000087.1/:1-1446(+)
MSECSGTTIAETFCCGICEDLMLEPTTLVCCGQSFCRACLQRWTKTNAQSGGVPRCPGGCGQRVPFRLPKHSIALRKAMEQLLPEQVALRIQEAAQAVEEEGAEDVCPGGFKAWQEIVANRDILYGNRSIVRQGSSGIVVGGCADGAHVTVKFDEREDGSELCVNLMPEAVMPPLPGGFRLRQKVVAIFDLVLSSDMKVQLGSVGSVIGSLGEDRVTVLFEPPAVQAEEQRTFPEFPVSVSIREVAAQRPLVGGFSIAQKVQSAMPLVVGSQVVVQAGCRGIVLGEYSESRLTVVFETSDDGAQSCLNVLPIELLPWCQSPELFPVGAVVQATHHLMASTSVMIVQAGTRGIILGGIEGSQVFVAFDGNHAVSISCSFLQLLPSEALADEALCCDCDESLHPLGSSSETAVPDDIAVVESFLSQLQEEYSEAMGGADNATGHDLSVPKDLEVAANGLDRVASPPLVEGWRGLGREAACNVD